MSEGIEAKPTMSPSMQNVLSWVMLIANSVVAAGKCRDERLSREEGGLSALQDVMRQSGLNIPGIEEALTQLMGGTEEAKKAATLIAKTPDPVSLLRKFADQMGVGPSANTGPLVTPPPPPPPTPWPAPSTTARSASTAPSPPRFRPDLTREAREAAKAAAAASTPRNDLASFLGGARVPVTPRQEHPALAERPSGLRMIEEQIELMTRRMQAHEAELDGRLRRVEFELERLRQEVVALRARDARVEGATRPSPEQPIAPSPEQPTASTHPEDAEVVADTAAMKHDGEVTPPLRFPAPTSIDHEAAAIALIGEFAGEVEARHEQNLARVLNVERHLVTTQMLLERQRPSPGVPPHG